MKTQIDIVTGFLGSGKTTFINGLLQSDLLARERIVIILCEGGEEEIYSELPNNRNVNVERVENEKLIDAVYVKNVVRKHLPDRIIIEHNGMSKVEDLLNTLQTFKVSKTCNINMVFHLIDSSTFDVFMNNMGSILSNQISNSDLIIINNIQNLSMYKINKLYKTLAIMKKSARIINISSREGFKRAIDQEAVYPECVKPFFKPSDKLFLVLILLVVAWFIFTVIRAVGLSNIDLTGLQVFNTVFLSILIQAFPFILFGVFISSILQVLISQETIVKFFPRNRIAAFVVAVISGFLFPVCDCAIVPVAGRLVKKGVPLPIAITFMLSAPIVNPIVIASTVYAFPGQPFIAFYRVCFGVTVAIAVGLTFMFFPEKESMLRNDMDNSSCGCGCCDNEYETGKGFMRKIDAIFMHSAAEFFEVGRFLVVGAFLSSVVQTILPKDILTSLGGGSAMSLLVMMLSAFILSICSTSDAFIARTFTGQFPIGSVMGFLVLGPMIDIKNLLMLLGNFRKGFVIKLVFIIFSLSFALLYVFTLILM